jgi:hypothetical protein
MKKVPIAIISATLFMVLFNLFVYTGMALAVLPFMFCMSPFVIIYMAYAILKYGKPSVHTFDERFYDDWDYQRNGKEEMNDE